MNNSYENLWKTFNGKTKDGYGTILVRFGDAYIPVLAKPKDPTDEILEDIDEAKRLNLTAWEYKPHPALKKIKKTQVSGTGVLYFNGAEVAWKFYDCGPRIDLTMREAEKVDDVIETMRSPNVEWWKLYEPHNDHYNNYGDEDTHAVYDRLGIKGDGGFPEKVLSRINKIKDNLDLVYEDILTKKKNHKKMELDRERIESIEQMVRYLDYETFV